MALGGLHLPEGAGAIAIQECQGVRLVGHHQIQAHQCIVVRLQVWRMLHDI